MGLGGKIAGGLSVALLVVCGIGYWYYTSSQESIAVLTENNTKLEIAAKTNEKTIVSLQAEYARITEETQRLNSELANTRRTNQILVEKLSEHDIGFLAANKPELIENIINNASDNALRCFEILSGSPLTQYEKNATSGREFNNECPWLWSDSK